MGKRRVAITGIGVVSSIGNDKDEFFKSLLSGNCGIEEFTEDDYPHHSLPENVPSLAGRIKGFIPSDYFTKDEIDQFDYPTLTVLKAVGEAIEDSKPSFTNQNVGVIVGSATSLHPTYNRLISYIRAYSSGNINYLPMPQYYPAVVMEYMMDTVLSAIFKKFNLQGEGLCLSTLCTSGATAICLGTESIRNGSLDVVICLGFDHFHPRQNIEFSHFKMLTEEKNIPFDRSSKGFQLAEGIGVVVLEDMDTAKEKRGFIYGEVISWGMTNDAYHLVIPSPSGREFAKAIEMAIKDADIELKEIDYISLTGRGSRTSDIKELEGVRRVFGQLAEKIPINSITSYTGYPLGASGVFNFITTLLQMKEKTILPILNFDTPHSEYIKWSFVKERMEKEINMALVCCHAFTGVNTAIDIKRYE